jgi:hypothetical protein
MIKVCNMSGFATKEEITALFTHCGEVQGSLVFKQDFAVGMLLRFTMFSGVEAAIRVTQHTSRVPLSHRYTIV